VNAYYGALLWASVALSPAYVQYAQLLLASEQQAARVYWHLYPQQSATDPNNPYPEASVRALTTMGNVQDWQTGAFLWWGSQKSEIAAIQMLPVTPVNELLYDAQWVQNVWQYTASEFADPTIADSWFVVLDIMVLPGLTFLPRRKSIIIAAYSNSNPQMAAAWSTNLTDWGTGNTYTNELFFISTRPNPSGAPICSSMPQNPVGNFTIQVGSAVAVPRSQLLTSRIGRQH
jgi:endo-1,3(4)-beta-glucanase